MRPQFQGDLFQILIAKLAIGRPLKDIGDVDWREIHIMLNDPADLLKPLRLGSLVSEVSNKGTRKRPEEHWPVA